MTDTKTCCRVHDAGSCYPGCPDSYDPFADGGDYAEHAASVGRVAALVLRRAVKAFPEWASELYVWKMEADGQYWTVSVGVSNQTDFQTIVDEGDV